MTKHYIIFIHGIGEAGKDNTPEQSYARLWKSIADASGLTLDTFNQRYAPIPTDWHIDPLEKAADELQQRAFGSLKNQWFNPMRGVRGFMTFFLGDVTAYVSEDVNFIRRTVWEQFWRILQTPLEKEGATYSIVAHSLGSVIAFDYIFELFERNRIFVPRPDPSKRPEDRVLAAIDSDPARVALLQDRFRHLFTLGSPIGLFMLRKGALWIDVDPPFSGLIAPVRGNNRRWLNFWDSEDPIAYPLENLFPKNEKNRGSHLEDIAVETGFLLVDSHTGYWNNRDVAGRIAKTLTAFP